LTWQHVSDLQFWNNAVAKAYGVNSISNEFPAGSAGEDRGEEPEREELDKKLEEIYKN